MRQSLRLGSISGIPVGINWGLLLVAGFFLLNLAGAVLPASVPGAAGLSYWVFAAGTVVLFFGSILAHELGHSLVAQRNGIGVRAITLWFLGGVAELEREADDPGVEFRIAIAGPAVSMVLGVGFGLLALASSVFVGEGLLTASFGYLALINVVLAVFNMIPAAPLDGGRVLSAYLWRRSENRHQARATAARVGEFFGGILIAVGVLGVLAGQGTLLLGLLGVFLRVAAGAERQRAARLDAMTRAGVRDAMAPIQRPITAGITLAGLESMAFGTDRPHAFPLWGPDGVVGLVPSSAVATVPPARRAHETVDRHVIEWHRFTSARTDEAMADVHERARLAGKQHVLVYDPAGHQVGHLDLSDIVAPQPA